MANNEVFVNGLEVACKAADGKSVAAFPDPCWSPPFPSAGPIVIPYANTAYAKDLTNATKTVMITGKPVAQKDKSYFKTSTGNEAATNAFDKGYMSHAIKGKAYFRSWSMNVFVEGFNVCRHTDGMTHNHGSTTNTAYWHYFDKGHPSRDCEKDARRITKACGDEVDKNDKNKEKQQEKEHSNSKLKKGVGKKLEKIKKIVSFKVGDKDKRRVKVNKKTGEQTEKNRSNIKTWKDNHCKGLMLHPSIESIEEFKKHYEEISANVKRLQNTSVGAIVDEAYKLAEDEIKSYMLEAGAKIAAKSVFKSWLGPIGWAWTAYDVVSAGVEAKDLYDDLDEIKKNLNNIKKNIKDNINQFKSIAPKIDNLLNKEDITQDDIATAMGYYANMNPCVRARRCKLVNYNHVSDGTGTHPEYGCCPGQTGNHLIPDSFMRDAPPSKNRKGKPKCKGYTTGKAPTMCVEGVTSTDGTHGDSHKAFDDAIGSSTSPTISYNEAFDAAVDSAMAVAPHCDRKCIIKQLKKYYDDTKICGKNKPTLRRATIPIRQTEENKSEDFN
ncbi:MAG: DUF4150 domain-containing protein [Pasteurella sp.]|nr:DUF4150 domain-containing protein [Pasteurella sp.]